MNTEDMEKILAAVSLPEVRTPAHARRLKTALLASKRFERSSYAGVWNGIHHSISYAMSHKKAVVGMAAAAFVLAGAFTFGAFQGGTAYAQAREIVKAAQVQAFRISPEMRAALERSIGGSMEDALKEAYAAPDLRRMTPEEYAKDGNTLFTVSSANQPQGITTPVTYLVYTNPQGKKVVLGLDENKTLVIRIAPIDFGDGAVGMSVQGGFNETSGTQGESGGYTAGTPIDASQLPQGANLIKIEAVPQP